VFESEKDVVEPQKDLCTPRIVTRSASEVIDRLRSFEQFFGVSA
jgi:hypothetical protein